MCRSNLAGTKRANDFCREKWPLSFVWTFRRFTARKTLTRIHGRPSARALQCRGAVAGSQDFAEDSPKIKVAPRLVAAKGGRIQGGRAMGTKSQGGA